MRTMSTCRRNKSTCHLLQHRAQNEWKLLIFMLLRFNFLSLMIPSSLLTEILWKTTRHSRTTVVGIRRNPLWKQPLSIQNRISILYAKITWYHPFNRKVRAKFKKTSCKWRSLRFYSEWDRKLLEKTACFHMIKNNVCMPTHKETEA